MRKRVLPIAVCLLLGCAAGYGQQTQNQSTQSQTQNPPKRRTPEEIANTFRNAKSAHFKVTPNIRHPRASAALNPAILAQLQAQKAAAALGPTHTMGATGDSSGDGKDPASGSSNPPAGAGNPAGGNPSGGSTNPNGGGPNPTGAGSGGSTNPAGGTTNPTGAGSNPPGSTGSRGGSNPSGSGTSGGGNPPSAVGPVRGNPSIVKTAPPSVQIAATPPPPSGGGSKNNFGVASANSHISACVVATDQAPIVTAINSRRTVIFTPDPNGNSYAIVGCHFGSSKGTLQLEGAFRHGNVSFEIDSWSDTLIKARVNPSLTGEVDLDNVTLDIIPTGRSQAGKFPGHSFYAAREQVNLQAFPASRVALATVMSTEGYPVKAVFSSPYQSTGAQSKASASNAAAGVDRNFPIRFNPGVDVWDLNGLAPQFSPVSFQLSRWALEVCSGTDFMVIKGMDDATIYNDGQWNAQWDPQNDNRIIVNFAEQHCHLGGGFLGVGDDESNSSYALTIIVVGPKGVNPWP